MKKVLVILLTFFTLSSITDAHNIWQPTEVVYEGVPRMVMSGASNSGKFVEISYNINYAGFVEIHLFNGEGKKVWIKGQVIEETGDHKFRVPTKPLKSGQNYSFILMYKGKEHPGTFSI